MPSTLTTFILYAALVCGCVAYAFYECWPRDVPKVKR